MVCDGVVRSPCLCRSVRIRLNPLGAGALRTQPDQTHGNSRHTGSPSITRSSLARQSCSKLCWDCGMLTLLGPRRASSASGACCSPASIKCCCNQAVRGASRCPRPPASLLLPAPSSETRAPNPSPALEKKVREQIR